MTVSRVASLARRMVERTLTERCDIERETGATGLMGEPLHQWEMVEQDVPCRVISTGGQGSQQSQYAAVGATETMVERWRLICPVGTTLKTDSRVRLTDGRVYQIVSVEDRLSDAAFAGALMVRARDE